MAGIENIKMHSQPEFMAGQNVKYNNASNVQQDIRVSQLERVPDADELNTQNTGNTTKTDRLIGEIKDYVDNLTPKQKQIGVLSLLIPGLGQLLNGEYKKVLGFLFADTITSIMTLVFSPAIVIQAAVGVYSALDAIDGLEKKENNKDKNIQAQNNAKEVLQQIGLSNS